MGAGLSAIGSLGAAALPVIGQMIDIQSAKDYRSWLGKMSDTAIRRQMADLKAAGLNPILAARLGGAVTPTGGLPHGQRLSEGVASAVAVKRAFADVARTKAETRSKVVEGELDDRMLKYLDQHPELKDSVLGTRLFKRSGVPGTLGLGLSSALDVLRQIMREVQEKNREARTRRLWRDVDKKAHPDVPHISEILKELK